MATLQLNAYNLQSLSMWTVVHDSVKFDKYDMYVQDSKICT